jgi:Concanavalin A-like lectin/glucanases superfamily
VPNGLVGYWPLDWDSLNFTSGTASDMSGQGQTATLANLPASALAIGQVGSALTFNGTSSYLTLGIKSYLSANFSMQWWFQTASTAVQTLWYNLNTAGNTQFGISLNRDAGFGNTPGDLFIYAEVSAVGAPTYAFSIGSAIYDGQWNHLILVRNGTSLLAYFNNVLVTTFTITAGSYDTGNNIDVGADTRDMFFMNGSIDEFRIYNRAIDPWEVTQLYKAGFAGRRAIGPSP